MDLGDLPDIIDKRRKQKLMTGNHPLGKHPALAGEHSKRMASSTYKKMMDKVHRYNGGVPRTQQDTFRLAQDMFGALRTIQQIEAAHKEDLEKLAVELVLDLPEFKSLRKPVAQGELILRPELARKVDLQGSAMSDEPQEEPPEMQVPEIRQQIDDEVMKRRYVNAMIQGSAVSKDFAFELVNDRLNAIDPQLSELYGKLMSLIQLGYWSMDDEIIQAAAAAGGEEAQGGEARLSQDEEGRPVIIARGITFPIVVQELIKGLMEYLSFNDEDDPETRKMAFDKADFLDDETWSMLLGPSIWNQFLDAIGHDSHEIMPHLYDEINRMPLSEFNALHKAIIAGDPAAKTRLRQMAMKVKSELGDEQSESQRLVDGLIS